MENQTPDQIHSAYIGDMINGLAKEAAVWKSRAIQTQAQASQLQAQVLQLQARVAELETQLPKDGE